jgi:PAS domain S-box-containing protein
MTTATATQERTPTGLILLVRILGITFAAELIVDRLLPGLLPPKGGGAFVFFHVMSLNLISAPLVWFFVVLPIGRLLENGRPAALLPLFGRLLAFMLTIELVTIELLPESLAGFSDMLRQSADAFLVALASASLFWRTIVRFCASRSLRRPLTELPVPIVFLYKLILVLFVIEFAIMKVLEWVGPFWQPNDSAMIDAALLCFFSAPFLWWLVVRPLRLSLIAEKAQFDHVISQVVDAVITIDEGGQIETFNKSAERIFGCQAQEMLGRSVQTIIDFPDDWCGAAAAADPGPDSAGPVLHSLTGLRCDGQQLPLSVSTSLARFDSRTLQVLIIRDMTAERNAAQEKERLLALFEATLQATADGILAVDWRNRKFQMYNDQFVEMFGIAEVLAEHHDDTRVLDLVMERMADPAGFRRRVEELYSEPDLISLDLLQLKDGRMIERYSQPQRLNGVNFGRVWSFRDITSRIRTEESLRQSVERFRTLATSSPVGIIETDARGTCLFVNQQWCQLAGITAEEAIGRSWTMVLHREEVAWVMEAWSRSLAEGTRFEMEYRFRTPTGEDNWVLGSATPLRNDQGVITGYLGIIIDINERKMVEKALQESEERFRQIFEQTEDAIVLFSPGSCAIIDLNPTAEMLYGYSKEELSKLRFDVFKDKADYQKFMKRVCLLDAGQYCQVDEMLNLRQDGSEIHVSVRAKVIKLQGREIIYCTLRDITERLRVEENSRAIQAQLITTNKMASLGLLVTGIAHEINNPNNYIMVNAQLLDRVWQDLEKLLEQEFQERGDFVLGGLPYSDLKESLPEMIESINEGSRRIRDIINNFKNYARQGVVAKGDKVDINWVIKSTMMLLNHHINRFTSRFQLELADDIPLINGSQQQLEQVLVNLIMNALQSLTDRRQSVEVKTAYAAEAGKVVITVRDEGCGIPAESLSRIMEPFFTTKLDSGGTGLGLSISQSIIKAHLGTLEVASESGHGTIFTVILPVSGQGPESDNNAD